MKINQMFPGRAGSGGTHESPVEPSECAMRTNLAAEFDLAWRNLTQEHREHLADAGSTFRAMLRAGDLGVQRIATLGRLYAPSPAGFPAVILAVWYPAAPSIYTLGASGVGSRDRRR